MSQEVVYRILVVEDDKNAGILLSENLQMHGYYSVLAIDGEEGWKRFNEEEFDLCILDIMMPKKDGLQLAKEIREENKQIPILFLTARAMDADKIQGFNMGCDDYLTKPYNIQELLLRMKAVLRRTHPNVQQKKEQNIYKTANLNFNFAERKIEIGTTSVIVAQKEAQLLKLFFDYENEVISRSIIMKKIWGKDDYFIAKSMDVYLSKLRKHIKDEPLVKITNIHGYGYKFEVVKDSKEV